jgi:hypothetical protein
MRVRNQILFGVLLALLVVVGSVGIAAYYAVGTFAVVIPESLKENKPGALVAVDRIGKYPAFVAQCILTTVHLPDPIDVTDGIALYRVKYRTTNHDGSVVIASGLVALPNSNALNSSRSRS